MIKDITIGQYFPFNSVIHRLDPRTKLLFTVVFIIMVFASNNFVSLFFNFLLSAVVIGLSKIARICDMVCKRLQLQERICSDIAEIMQKVCDTEDVIVIVDGEHSCMTARGIKSRGAKTRTSAIRGLFDSDHELRREVYDLLR